MVKYFHSFLYRLMLVAFALTASTACRSIKLEEGQYILKRVSLDIEGGGEQAPTEEHLLSYIGQQQGRKVIYNPSESEYSIGSLSSAIYNMGYLRGSVSLELDTLDQRYIHSRYRVKLGEPFYISNHSDTIADPVIKSLLHPVDTLLQKIEFPIEQYSSLLDSGQRLSPDVMQSERKRITQILRNRGYWGFREDFVRFDVDTLGQSNDVWLRTRIDTTLYIYRVGEVRVHQGLESSKRAMARLSTLEGVKFYSEKVPHIRPSLLLSKMWLRPGELYAQDLLSRTYSAFSDMPAIRSLNITTKVDTTRLNPTIDLDIFTQVEKSKELTADVVGTHSGGNLGAIASLAFMHNNIFSGAEQFRLSGNIGYEDLGVSSSDHLSYGIEASLRFPNMLIPFWRERKQRNTRGQTEATISYNYLTRPEFNRSLFSSSWAYSWTQYRYPAFRYVYKPLEIDYMRFGYMDASFLAKVPEYDRMLNYRNQLVVSMSFMVSYNSTLDLRRASSPFLHNIRLYLQSSGNVLYGLSSLLSSPKDAFGAYTFNTANIVQFVKAELDYSGLYKLGGKNALAYHAAVSTVIPYGNSTFIPIDLRYFSGGASSLRGWGARGLGPGSMSRSVGTSIFHQVGDIKLDLSTELRLRFAPSWEFALFADAGNIWTIRKYKEQAGGDFDFKRFYKEIALNTGLGLRWDFDYFLLRVDAGLKVYDPQRETTDRWCIGRTPLRDLIGLHFALGYPF